MKKAKESPDQLLLDFEQSRAELSKAIKKLNRAAEALADAAETPATDNPDDREAVNRLAKIVATQTGQGFHSVWVLAYHRLFMQTGFHAVAASGGKGIHLDTVQEAGHMRELITVLTEMLTDESVMVGGRS